MLQIEQTSRSNRLESSIVPSSLNKVGHYFASRKWALLGWTALIGVTGLLGGKFFAVGTLALGAIYEIYEIWTTYMHHTSRIQRLESRKIYRKNQNDLTRNLGNIDVALGAFNKPLEESAMKERIQAVAPKASYHQIKVLLNRALCRFASNYDTSNQEQLLGIIRLLFTNIQPLEREMSNEEISASYRFWKDLVGSHFSSNERSQLLELIEANGNQAGCNWNEPTRHVSR